MRVLLADDQVWLRSAIRFLLQEEPDVETVEEAGDLHALLTKAKKIAPDLILVDWELPGVTTSGAGRRLIQTLRAASPNVTIVALSGRPEASRSVQEAGADGFVSKADPPDRLLAIIRSAAESKPARKSL